MQLQDELQLSYKGKIAKRRDGRQRRTEILEATLKIITEDGIRSVRHRNVASMAGVPLSATTYYFDDIDSLIHDAFVYYIEKSIARVRELEVQAWEALNEFQHHRQVELLRHALHHFVVAYIRLQVEDKESRMLDWVFKQEALRDPTLADVFIRYQRRLDAAMVHFCSTLEVPQPREMAHIINGTMVQLEYLWMVEEQSMVGEQEVYRVVDTLLRRMLQTKTT